MCAARLQVLLHAYGPVRRNCCMRCVCSCCCGYSPVGGSGLSRVDTRPLAGVHIKVKVHLFSARLQVLLHGLGPLGTLCCPWAGQVLLLDLLWFVLIRAFSRCGVHLE